MAHKDEVTVEQGYIDDESSCFRDMDDNGYTCSPDRLKAPSDEKKRKAKEKAKVDGKGPEEHSLVKNKHRILNGGQKRTLLGGPEEREARKAFQKKKQWRLSEKWSSHLPTRKRRRQGFHPAQRQRKGPKRKGQGAHHQSGLSASETPR